MNRNEMPECFVTAAEAVRCLEERIPAKYLLVARDERLLQIYNRRTGAIYSCCWSRPVSSSQLLEAFGRWRQTGEPMLQDIASRTAAELGSTLCLNA